MLRILQSIGVVASLTQLAQAQRPAQEKIDILADGYHCQSNPGKANAAYGVNAKLRAFYRDLEAGGPFIGSDTAQWANELLCAAASGGGYACMLPVIRLIDPMADSIYRTECIIRAAPTPDVYCESRSLAELVLVFLEYRVIRRLTVPVNQRITMMRLEHHETASTLTKNNGAGRTLSTGELAEVCQRYAEWFSHRNPNRTRLDETKYAWKLVISTERSLPPK